MRTPDVGNAGAPNMKLPKKLKCTPLGICITGKPGSQDILLPAGSYFFQKAGEAHITKCVSENECIIFLSQPGKYDFIPTK
jgi:hypothetical protein